MSWQAVRAAARAVVSAEARAQDVEVAGEQFLENQREYRRLQADFARAMIDRIAGELDSEARRLLGVLRASVLALEELEGKPMHPLELLTVLAGDSPDRPTAFLQDLQLRLRSRAALEASCRELARQHNDATVLN